MVIGDIDNFKSCNDRYGHDCGDSILKAVTDLMKSTIRKQDWIGRWGGEEFILVFPYTDQEGGRIIAEKIRKIVATRPLPYRGDDIFLTMTFGVTVYDRVMSMDDCIKKADEALYSGKLAGKNCVRASD